MKRKKEKTIHMNTNRYLESHLNWLSYLIRQSNITAFMYQEST